MSKIKILKKEIQKKLLKSQRRERKEERKAEKRNTTCSRTCKQIKLAGRQQMNRGELWQGGGRTGAAQSRAGDAGLVGGSGKLHGQKTSSPDRLKARQILKYCFRIFAIAFLAKGK